jgi:hypothetical protein
MNRLASFCCVGLLAILFPSPANAQDHPASTLSWSVLLDSAAEDPAQASALEAFVEAGRGLALPDVIRRAYTLEEVGKNRTWLDGRSNNLEDEIRATFALAMSDFAACNTIAKELPSLAATYRLTQEEALRQRVVKQLEEMATWTPLQRPGWSLYAPGHRLPDDGKDGNWLATGCGIRAIADTLELMPGAALEPELRNKLHRLLEKEIESIVDDWETKRPWFVRTNNPVTNQWVLPTEGLVRACLVLGKEKHAEAYELGVKNLIKALDVHGDKGEFEEGFGYASFTVASMLHAARAMALQDDRRALEHPFLKNFSIWLCHHFQPGDMVVNCFDAGGAYQGAEHSRSLLSLLGVCTNNSVARWALAEQTSGPSDDLAGLAVRGLAPVGEDAAPELFAVYERAARVNWRDSWDANANGLWIRGGHELDQHDHQDRGHVNYIAQGKPILIEAGTPSYHHKMMATHYSSGAGHNILQIGDVFPQEPILNGIVILPGWQQGKTVAPIEVRLLDAKGGDVAINISQGYAEVEQWLRRVTWDNHGVNVEDAVTLNKGVEDLILFRWHLGTESQVEIRAASDTKSIASWPDATITVEADQPITLTQTKMPDHTLAGHDGSEDEKNVHTCLIVQTKNKAKTLKLTTYAAPTR